MSVAPDRLTSPTDGRTPFGLAITTLAVSGAMLAACATPAPPPPP